MDEEDLADAQEAQHLKVSGTFAGLGSSTGDASQSSGLSGLFKVDGDTMGLKLLRRMGWKDGQGIGPRIKRAARLDMTSSATDGADEYLFAPDDTSVIALATKTDRKGIGFRGNARLQSLNQSNHRSTHESDEDETGASVNTSNMLGQQKAKTKKPSKGSFGVGVLNDTGSDDEDPYEMGPKISYNRVMGGDTKKKNKGAAAASNPKFKNKPIFVPKMARGGNGLRRCRDGRLPLSGFVLAQVVEDLVTILSKYAPPPVPEGWKSEITRKEPTTEASTFTSTTDAAKASSLDPRSRAAILGEKTLPGKSVFDYISMASRDKLATASGRNDLPPARGEMFAEKQMSEEEKLEALWDQAPVLDRDTAIAALSRGSKGPYADNEQKKARYRSYLEHVVNSTRPMPEKLESFTDSEFVQELTEFYNCARIFKPMVGFMASKFTSAKSSPTAPTQKSEADSDLLSKPAPTTSDPAEEAAKMGMYGALTRSLHDFYPTRLLCKRFNVKPPAQFQPDQGSSQQANSNHSRWNEQSHSDEGKPANSAPLAILPPTEETSSDTAPKQLDPEKNDAVEAKAADPDLLHAVFGDSDDDD